MRTDVFEEARNLKSRAMDKREHGDFDGAKQLHEHAIDILADAWPGGAPPKESVRPGGFEQKLAKALAHQYGSLGGTYRAWQRFGDSVGAYDEGWKKYENNSVYRIVDSYALTQRLVARVLLDPWALIEPGKEVEKETFPDVLSRARDTIRDQLARERANDEWAKADLAVTCLLLGDAQEDEAWESFASPEPTLFAVEATDRVLEEIQKRLTSYAKETKEVERFQPILDRLDRARSRMQKML